MAPKKNRTAIKLSAKDTRTIAAIEEQARDIQFPAAVETELRQAATRGREAQELAVAITTKNKPQAYVVAAWKVIDDASKEASARASRRRRYRRRAAWTMRDRQTALSLAASGDYSVAEIARKLGRSEEAVRHKLLQIDPSISNTPEGTTS
jgi:DNA-binding CsgD family transcriptional regulator